jgi:hypothetical protein
MHCQCNACIKSFDISLTLAEGQNLLDCLCGLPALFCLSSYVSSHHLAVAPKSGAKDQFYCTVYCITLNSNCEAQRVSKNLKKM